jgi:uncharacterized surface protein with fasciclin (FAS1) repeats
LAQIAAPGVRLGDLGFFAHAPAGGAFNAHTPRMKNFIDAATHAGKASALLSAFRSASSIDLLRSPGRFTTHAPSAEAFERLSSGSVDALFKRARTLEPSMSSHMMTGTAAANDTLAS